MAKAQKNENQVPVERRGSVAERRASKERRTQQITVNEERRVTERREKVPRRRQIDPTTCERDYSDDEVEFMNALDRYKRANGRMFPTCSEILEVIRGLGYIKAAVSAPQTLDAEPTALPVDVVAIEMTVSVAE